jgi:hypothetical protein
MFGDPFPTLGKGIAIADVTQHFTRLDPDPGEECELAWRQL